MAATVVKVGSSLSPGLLPHPTYRAVLFLRFTPIVMVIVAGTLPRVSNPRNYGVC